jgi:ribosome-associated protein
MTRRNPVETDLEPPSKSELKRRSRDLQDLGDALVELPAAEFDALDLPDELRDAIEAARRISSHGARLRQRLFIGKLLRRIDTTEVVAAMHRRGDMERARLRGEKQIEQWRERLLSDDETFWEQLAREYPTADLDELRTLARQARSELAARRPPAAARALFRRLRAVLAAGSPA